MITEQLTTYTSQADREEMAANMRLGCGNFLEYAIQYSPDPEAELIHFQFPYRHIDGKEYHSFSLHSLKKVAKMFADWYYFMGVREKDPIALQFEDGPKYLIHYVALTQLGAIPVFINNYVKPEIVTSYIRHVRARAFLTDAGHFAKLEGLPRDHWASELLFALSDETIVWDDQWSRPDAVPFQHDDFDPVAVFHTSGTTGMPKPVCAEHQQLFFAIRHDLPKANPTERYLSATISSHTSYTQFNIYYLLLGCPIMIMSDLKGVSLLHTIDSFRPTIVAAFYQTYASMAELNLDDYDLSSVELWFSSGDCAHEKHVRKIVKKGRTLFQGRVLRGARFLDGYGSTEMGSFLIKKVFNSFSNDYNRCIGYPVEYAEAAVIGDEGELLGDYEVGRMGLKSPSINRRGYWNSSEATFKSRVKDYFLTGDMVYRDEHGMYYQVDRIQDVIRTKSGKSYSLLYEEMLLKTFEEINDCAVFGCPSADGCQEPVAIVQFKQGRSQDPDHILEVMNRQLQEQSNHPLARVLIAAASEDMPLGPTGKVLKKVLRERYENLLIQH